MICTRITTCINDEEPVTPLQNSLLTDNAIYSISCKNVFKTDDLINDPLEEGYINTFIGIL
jgi:hypothetical protein